ncbi:F-box domain [Thalictrum thalictroides]|uniref:F-box domain n=1 Tax=Thalictrum thalictroides TaxID=46969 RepID=A0A7J6XBZ3_THATH|nr:F-box domain [Thalictrum thalictroides]
MFYLDDSREEEEGYGKEPIFIKPLKMFDKGSMAPKAPIFSLVLGSCNGLVCLFSFNPVFVPFHIRVFNPITEEYLNIPQYEDPQFDFMRLHDFGAMKYSNCSYGFGFEESMQVYKVVLVMFSAPQFCKNEVQIYTLGSTTWRRKPGIAPKVLNGATGKTFHSPVFVNGCLHWLAFSNDEPLIVSFNLCREDFGYIPVPRKNLLQRPYCLTFGEYIVSYNITSKQCQFLKVEGLKEEGNNLLQGYPFVGSLLSLKSACGMDPDTKETSKED